MIDLKFAFRSMIDRSGFDRSDRSFSRIVWPLLYGIGIILSSLFSDSSGKISLLPVQSQKISWTNADCNLNPQEQTPIKL